MRRAILTATILTLVIALGGTGWAYRDYFTPEQREQLRNIQVVRADVIALTDKGSVDASDIRELVVERMEGLRYEVVTDAGDPHDVVLKVKCEQYKTWEGTARHGGDADLPDAPVRLWRGPACQISYVLGGKRIDWRKEVRAEFEDPIAAAKAANWDDPGLFATNNLRGQLAEYDFAVYVTAEWGQAERLLELLDRRGVDDMRKLRIISLLGEMQADEALPQLEVALKDKNLSKQAAMSIGNLGSAGIPLLIDLMKNSKDPELQAAAAKGLGRVGGIAGDPRIVLPLLEMLDPPGGVDVRVQIEVVWALGKMPDKRSIEPLYALERKAYKRYEPENRQLTELKEALSWSIKQTDVTHDVGG